MTPYEKEHVATTTATNEIVEVPFPGRITIERIAIVRIDGGAISATPYNRKFVGDEVAVRYVTEALDDEGAGTGKVRLELMSEGLLHVRVGDTITIRDSAAASDTARVTKVEENMKYVETDGLLSAVDVAKVDGGLGVAFLNIPSAEHVLYQVTSAAIAGTASATSLTSLPYTNTDPRPTRNIGVVRKIYIKFADIGTYKIAIRGCESIGLN